MKFGKEFPAQMVQEWQEAYMKYGDLKTLLKDILNYRQVNPLSSAKQASRDSFKRNVTLYRAFSGLTSGYNRIRDSMKMSSEDEVIVVGAVQEGSSEQYETMVLIALDEGGEPEAAFFRRLDKEFNKVLKFYKAKTGEVVKEAQELNKQMDALIALRVKVDKPLLASMQADFNDLGASMNLSISRRKPVSHMDVIQEDEVSQEENEEDDEASQLDGGKTSEQAEADTAGPKMPSLEVLEHVKINVEAETPVTTLRRIFASSQSELSFSKEELRKVEEQMKRAFIEFYNKLRLLKSYSFLNQMAFSKILKKYDKITSRNASKPYLDMVENAFSDSSSEVSKLVERVEATFIKHFSNGNRKRGLKILRPHSKKERHVVTFSLGFFFGCTIALLVAVIVLVHARNIMNSDGRQQYMENIFPLYSLFGFIVLHLIMYSANIYFWRHFRVNYSFIFGLKQGKEMGYREVLLVSSGLSVLALAAVISNLDMDMDPRAGSFHTLAELVPLGLVILVLLIAFCPFNIIYRSSRFFFIQCIFRCLCAPWYKVTLPDFFLGDQLTSQVQALRSLEFYVCYYGWGDFKRRSNQCHQSDAFEVIYVIIAVVPYWIRFLQCVRRLVEEKDHMHITNGVKYLSTIIAVVMRTGHDLKWGGGWKIMAVISSAVATMISTYWDIVIDWGLLRKDSRNPWLRDRLLVPYKSVYFIAIVVNGVLRLAWMQSVFGFHEAPFLHKKALTAIVACLEIIRRGIWNFFRLENEHLNNVGKYRAFKSVPLPFSYDYGAGGKHA